MLEEPPPENAANNALEISTEGVAIIEHIVAADGAFFRHQQINDPDIGIAERRHIATQLWHSGARQFLARFRQHLDAEQLQYIARQCDAKDGRAPANADDAYEIGFYVRDSLERLKNRGRDVRNRRFEAMQRMLRAPDCSYFDEAEMMAREPLLYERLIGQYMTDGERVRRDKAAGDGSADGSAEQQFSGVLMNGIVRDQVAELRRQQEESERQQLLGDDAVRSRDDMAVEEEYDTDDDDGIDRYGDVNGSGTRTEVHADGIIDDEYYPQVPPSFHQRWGDFEDSRTVTQPQAPPVATRSSRASEPPTGVPAATSRATQAQASDQKQNYVTAEEREALCDEFYAAMYESFLQGRDVDFDYAAVDDNADYDDLEQLNRDQEDRYFDAEDDDDDEGEEDGGAGITAGLAQSSISDARDGDAEDEDELDTYMKQINA